MASGYVAVNSKDHLNGELDDLSFAAHFNFISKVKEQEIKDRSCSDGVGKIVAVGQTTWFTVQLVARQAEGLPVTELEIMTLAFATMDVLVCAFWWDKPQGVNYPIPIQRLAIVEDIDDLPVASIQKCSDQDITSASIFLIDDEDPFNAPSKRVSSFERSSHLEPTNAMDKYIAYYAAGLFGLLHCSAWTSTFPSIGEEVLWKICSLLVTCVPI
ncbi:hypothetical protein GYMLUDRAFT_181496 [Collybiopsis luxurians FD-317 M1]|uniref:Unplaced genomic scaffold GYMLUscaffold_116, whole genome shotgun sequence n=1 Tax=Collybiopsis luxurians FD-317 M1 TaxID=944289 RepID=A0A0D0C126_9AGAR|nr:hypothetical protein GYMLUDRAFT_181496 [Collybiopsis luxurians FD-317 M1]